MTTRQAIDAADVQALTQALTNLVEDDRERRRLLGMLDCLVRDRDRALDLVRVLAKPGCVEAAGGDPYPCEHCQLCAANIFLRDREPAPEEPFDPNNPALSWIKRKRKGSA